MAASRQPNTVTLSITIARDWREVYARFWRPDTFALWARGLSQGALREIAGGWQADGPGGLVSLRFTDRNEYGIMDHWVSLASGAVVYVPMRVVARGTGAEVMLTLFRQPDMDDAAFTRDAAWVEADLARLKTLAEGE